MDKQVREMTYDAEDGLAMYMLRFAYQRRDTSGLNWYIKKKYAWLKYLIARHQIASEFQEIRLRLDNVSKSRERFKEVHDDMNERSSNKTYDTRGDALLLEEAEVVGIEKPKKQLLDWLMESDDGLKAISVVGMGGLGKTTLVKKIYDDASVTVNFNSHVWITVSENFNLEHLLRKMINQLANEIKLLPPQNLQEMDLAIDATTSVGVDLGEGLREVDIKKYIKVEKVPGGQLEDSNVLRGVMFNKDVVAPVKMRRKILNPRIILLDCPLEYKKGENQTNAELLREEDWSVLLKMEEEYIESLCVQILKFKPDLVITEKGLSDLACHYLFKAGVSAIRRLRKTDNNRIAKACGAVIVNRHDELQESDVGTGAGLFEVRKIGDEFFAFIVDCVNPKAWHSTFEGCQQGSFE